MLKNTNALVCLTRQEHRQDTGESVCIQCGRCVAACPMHLTPVFIRRALEQNQLRRLSKLHPEDCIQCGCCSFTCPARIPLAERVQQARDLLEKGGEAQ